MKTAEVFCLIWPTGKCIGICCNAFCLSICFCLFVQSLLPSLMNRDSDIVPISPLHCHRNLQIRINNLSIFHLMQIVQTLCGIVKLVYNKIKWKKILPSVHANFRSILLNANMKVMLLFHLIQTTQPKLCSVSFFYHVLSSLWMIGIYLWLFWTHVKWMNTFVHQHMAVNSQLFV